MSKKALLVGINYRGTSSELNGCINDVNSMRSYLQTKGYTDFTVLTDDTPTKPTRANILAALLGLILSGSSQLFFHYSGHGTQVKDVSGDEKDGKDEAICPIDYDTAGMIIDDEIRGIFNSLTTSQTLTVLLDCCHSGTGCDLAYNLYGRVGSNSSFTLVKDKKGRATNGKVVMLSGCRDNQTSADAFLAGKYSGAMTYSFLEAIKTKKTWDSLLKEIRRILKRKGFSQIPMLSSGRSLSLTSSISL